MPWWRRCGPAPSADETGWKQGGRRVWLSNLRETDLQILPGRGFEQAASVWEMQFGKEATLQIA